MNRLVLVGLLLALAGAPARAAEPVTVKVTSWPLWMKTGITLSVGQQVCILGPSGPVWSCSSNIPLHGIDGYQSWYRNNTTWDRFLFVANAGEMIGYVGDDPYKGCWGHFGLGETIEQIFHYYDWYASGDPRNGQNQCPGYLHVGEFAAAPGGFRWTADRSGLLWLGFNDDAKSKNPDNIGSAQVQIYVNEPPPQNLSPKAEAGADQHVHWTDTVYLDGTASSDPENDPLTYTWEMVARPAGSAAALDDIHSPTPSFAADTYGTYRVKLTVADPYQISEPDYVVVDTADAAPTAEAGPDLVVSAGAGGTATVTLDGSDSFDPDGDPLTYAWTWPGGSASGPRPQVSLPGGVHTITLVVSDGILSSPPDMVTVRVNQPPVAAAGADILALAGPNPTAQVTLNGSGSSDPDGDPLTYTWTWSGGSTSGLRPTVVLPRGRTNITLVVADPYEQSQPDHVQVFVNGSPTAEAGPNQQVHWGATVHLDATASADPDGDPLTYTWQMVARPAGSAAALSDARAAKPGFTADAEGTYRVKLVVADPYSQTSEDSVVIDTADTAPTANAGPDQLVPVGPSGVATVALDGSGSFDPDGDSLSYTWTWNGGSARGPSPRVSLPGGVHTITLVVSDGILSSPPDTVTVRVNRPPVAEAGPDLQAQAGSSRTAQVTLDGSGSSDPDGDPLTYTWTWSGGSTSGLRPTVELPQGLTTIRLVVADPYHQQSAPDYVRVTVSGESLVIEVTAPTALSVDDTGYGPNPVTVTARLRNNTSEAISSVAVSLNLPAGLWFDGCPATQTVASLPADGEAPVSWTVRSDLQPTSKTVTYTVSTASSGIAETSASESLALPAAELASLPESTQQGGNHASAYRMVAFPLAPEHTDAVAFLAADVGEPDSSRWRLYEWTGQGYREASAAGQVLVRRGCGYWLICRDTVSFRNLRGATGTGEGAFVIPLHQGWNLIGNPFDFPVSWSSVVATNVDDDPVGSGNTSPYCWTGDGSYARAEVLEPRTAYWVHVSAGEGQLSVLPPVAVALEPSAAARMEAASQRTPPPPPGGLTEAPSSGSGGWCFIATAAYGSPLEPHVQTLRAFRDACLLSNPLGASLVRLYYRLSPPLARYIEAREGLRAGARLMLLPLVTTAPLAQAAWPWGLVLAVAALGVVIGRTARRSGSGWLG